jgi:hypothetical protein
MTFAVAFVGALYSASMLDLDTVGCLFVYHDTRLEPKNIAKLPVDFLSSILLASLHLKTQLQGLRLICVC